MARTRAVSRARRPGPTPAPKLGPGRARLVAVKDQVHERLRFEIISFGLRPGERISESQLATRFGVGIASVRAVLPKLVQEGLIQNKRRLGHVIAPITVQEVRDICQLREMIEPQAAELAAPRIDIARLEEIDARSKVHVPEGDRAAEMASVLANKEFHVAIAAASGNERLAAWVAQLQDFSIRFQYLLRHSLHHDWEHSHEPIIDAMRRRDPAAAQEQMRAHLLTGREHLMKAILGLPTLRDVNIG